MQRATPLTMSILCLGLVHHLPALMPLRRLSCRRLPLGPRRDSPIPYTIPLPTRTINFLLLGRHKRLHRAHPVLVLWTTLDAGERGDPVVDNDADLLAGSGVAGQHYQGERETSISGVRDEETEPGLH